MGEILSIESYCSCENAMWTRCMRRTYTTLANDCLDAHLDSYCCFCNDHGQMTIPLTSAPKLYVCLEMFLFVSRPSCPCWRRHLKKAPRKGWAAAKLPFSTCQVKPAPSPISLGGKWGKSSVTVAARYVDGKRVGHRRDLTLHPISCFRHESLETSSCCNPIKDPAVMAWSHWMGDWSHWSPMTCVMHLKAS